MLQYLECGSEETFNNFCKALISSGQGHLVNAMNLEDRPVPGNECTESASVSVSEYLADVTTNRPVGKGRLLELNLQKSKHKIFHDPPMAECLTKFCFTMMQWWYFLLTRLMSGIEKGDD